MQLELSSRLLARTVIHPKVSRAIAKQKGHFPSFPDNLTDTKKKIYEVPHFPDVIGAVDCTHLRIISPNK